MRWFTLLSGVLLVGYLGAAAVDRYWAGVAFSKSWWPALLIPVFLIALLGLSIGCIWLVISVVRRRTKPIWLFLLVFPVLFVGRRAFPMPGFVDGMAHRVQRDFSAAEFLSFAKQARALKVNWIDHSTKVEIGMDALQKAFPRIMGLSQLEPPRVSLAATHVDLFYGSALVKHWGVRVMDKDAHADPFASEERAHFLEALPRVWVYHLAY